MPEVIQCPHCNRKLRVPDNLLGKKVKCPSCSSTFTATAGEEDLPTAPLIEDEGDSEVVRRRAKPSDEIQEKPSGVGKRPLRPPVEEEPDEDQEDDVEEDEPQPRRRRPVRYEEEDEDEDEDATGPRRARRRRSGRARAAVAAPAIALMVIGSISLALYLLQLILIFAGVGPFAGQAPQEAAAQQGQAYALGRMVGGVVGTIIATCWAGIVLSAGWQMKNLKGYGYAMTGSIIAMVPCNICCLLGIPFGIWSLVTLNKPEVKNAFR
jgi:predicted Zn finger-like uncharacterized protein